MPHPTRHTSQSRRICRCNHLLAVPAANKLVSMVPDGGEREPIHPNVLYSNPVSLFRRPNEDAMVNICIFCEVLRDQINLAAKESGQGPIPHVL